MGKPTFTSLFSGGGGADLGAIAAGFEPCEAVEYDPQIAELHKANIGGKCHVMNILDATPKKFEKVDWLHASPVCKEYSSAKAGAKETQFDIDSAIKITQFIEVLQPQHFSLENVAAYGNIRNEKGRLTAFGRILWALQLNGYSYSSKVLTASNYGVPQSRKRLILVASKGQDRPRSPEYKPSVGWYEAIADLLPDCKEAKFADWQAEMAKGITDTFVMSSTEQRANTIRYANQPIFTIKASDRDPRALISGKVIQLNTDCLARLQSFPKDYQFGSKVEVIRKVIGNAVPPLLFSEVMQAAIAPQVDLLSSMKSRNLLELAA